MKIRIGCLLFSILLLSSCFPLFCLTAYADTGSVEVTLGKGDTVYGLCEEMGLSYNANKKYIMKLNGFTSEYQLVNVKVGTTLLMPASSSDKMKYGISIGDTVKYYLVPYSFKKGDMISKIYYCWGLHYENYADDICKINNISNLDKIFVGKLLSLPTTEENLKNSNYTVVMEHLVKRGESTKSICADYGLDYDTVISTLMRFNGTGDLTKLLEGQSLLIPLE